MNECIDFLRKRLKPVALRAVRSWQMKLALTTSDLFRLLSPTGCLVEALSMAMLLVAMFGCAVAALS
jgi:hypothetical protein